MICILISMIFHLHITSFGTLLIPLKRRLNVTKREDSIQMCCTLSLLSVEDSILIYLEGYFDIFRKKTLRISSGWEVLEVKKQSLGGVLWKGCSEKFHKIHRKTLVLESLFNKVAGLRPATLSKKRLQHRCFSC